jgi:hypothetical protein
VFSAHCRLNHTTYLHLSRHMLCIKSLSTNHKTQNVSITSRTNAYTLQATPTFSARLNYKCVRYSINLVAKWCNRLFQNGYNLCMFIAVFNFPYDGGFNSSYDVHNRMINKIRIVIVIHIQRQLLLKCYFRSKGSSEYC